MTPKDEISDRLYDRIRSHQEHSDDMYTKYLTTLISISVAIFGAIGFLLISYFNNVSKYHYLSFIIPLSAVGFYVSYIFNYYMQNEKEYQKTLIGYYDEFVEFNESSILTKPDPFSIQKRRWSERGWTKVCSNLNWFYLIASVIVLLYLFIEHCPHRH